MTDDTATLGQDTTGAATEQTTSESTETGPVAPEASQGESTDAGASQERSDGGRDRGTDTRRPYRSKNQTIYELRQDVRERDAKLRSFEERLSSFEQKFQPRQNSKPSRTFWEAPEEVLDERISGHLSEMEKRIIENLQQTRQIDQQTSEWRQETLEASKLIKSELKLTEDEEEELADMLRSRPAVAQMRPLERADYALYLWNKEKGITDKSSLKNRAASVQGSGGSSNGGPRIWTESDIDREMKKYPPDPARWSAEQKKQFEAVDAEIRRAYKEQRVRK